MMEKCYDEGTLQAFLDNELKPELSQKVARHVGDCDKCAILLAEVEEETAFAFAALEQEFNTLVPTQRLWSKINESIEVQSRRRSFWQRLSGFASGLSFTNPHVIAFGSLLLIVGVVSIFIVIKNDADSAGVSVAKNAASPVLSVPSGYSAPVVDDVLPVGNDQIVIRQNQENPQFRIEKASFSEPVRRPKTTEAPKIDAYIPPQYLDGEESYIKTIARLERTVNENKDEVLKPSQRFSYEKDLALVNDTISKMKSEVRKNPRNESAKQILFSSYQNKIELLNSVSQRGDLMASLR